MGTPIGSPEYYYVWLPPPFNGLLAGLSQMVSRSFAIFPLGNWKSQSLIHFGLFPKKLAA